MGKFIVFEGIDGAGKSTQVALIKERLEAMGRKVALTAEPTSLESGKALREALSGRVKKSECEMAAMFVLDRIAHNKAEGGIDDLLDNGFDVISDRYYYSTLAYQGQTTNYAWVKSMNVDCPEIRRPDVCIYLDLLPEDSLARISARGEAREIYENLDRLTGVRKAFLSTIEDLKRDRENIFVIDASRSPEEIAADVFRVINDSILKD